MAETQTDNNNSSTINVDIRLFFLQSFTRKQMHMSRVFFLNDNFVPDKNKSRDVLVQMGLDAL